MQLNQSNYKWENSLPRELFSGKIWSLFDKTFFFNFWPDEQRIFIFWTTIGRWTRDDGIYGHDSPSLWGRCWTLVARRVYQKLSVSTSSSSLSPMSSSSSSSSMSSQMSSTPHTCTDSDKSLIFRKLIVEFTTHQNNITYIIFKGSEGLLPNFFFCWIYLLIINSMINFSQLPACNPRNITIKIPIPSDPHLNIINVGFNSQLWFPNERIVGTSWHFFYFLSSFLSYQKKCTRMPLFSAYQMQKVFPCWIIQNILV